MGLDIFVGTFDRYARKDWELSSVAFAREAGFDVTVVTAVERCAPANVPASVKQWQATYGRALETILDWDEGRERPYFTNRPGWDAHCALLTWTARNTYDDPAIEPPSDMLEAFAGLAPFAERGFKDVAFAHVAVPSLWLPAAFDPIVQCEDVFGAERLLGSSLHLREGLNRLNARTWHADRAAIQAWCDVPEPAASWERLARFGFAQFSNAVDFSLKHRLPILLDY